MFSTDDSAVARGEDAGDDAVAEKYKVKLYKWPPGKLYLLHACYEWISFGSFYIKVVLYSYFTSTENSYIIVLHIILY